MLDQIRALAETPPSAREMERVRASVTASQVYQRDSVMGQAMELGMLSTLGLDWRLAGEFEANLAKVTAEDVRDAARRWLVDERRTTAFVLPEKAQPENAQPEEQ